MQIKQDARKKTNSLKEEIASNYTTSIIEEKQYNFEFTVSNKESKLKVLVYFGKKGVRVVLQGNQDTPLYSDIDSIVNGSEAAVKPNLEIDEPTEYIGTDESGKGDYFGPLVTTAVFVDQQLKEKLLNLGVRDSKDFNDNQINRLAPKLKDILKENFETITLTPAKYNELYSEFNNLNSLLNWCHTTAIESLLNRVSAKEAIVDKFSNDPILIPSKNLKVHQFTKAEKYTAVATASILARYKFNQWFDGQVKAGILLPKGAVKGIVEAGKTIVQKFGRDQLVNYAKLHFKTTNEIV